MKLTRKEFIVGFGAAVVATAYDRSAAAEPPRIRLGVMSDIHVQRKGDSASRLFMRALDWCRLSDVDGVLLAGDLTEEGLEDQLQYVAEMYFGVFPEDKGRDGRDVARLVITGNHDIGEFWRRRLKDQSEAAVKACLRHSLTHNRDRIWRTCWNEPWAPIFRKDVKGMPFVGAHWKCWSERALKAFFAEHSIDPSRPFVYSQHSHPKGTVYGAGAEDKDADDGSSTSVLSSFPNVIAFSGHSHRPIRDARAIWQGGFTSIATGAISQVFVKNGCENSSFRCGHDGPPHMKMFDGKDGTTVLLVDFYEDRMTVRRQNIVYGEPVADDWTVRFPTSAGEWAFAPRAAQVRPPEFPSGIEVTVERRDGENRRREREDQIVVKFPRALVFGTNSVVEKYRVRVMLGSKEVLSRHVYAQKHFLAESRVRNLVKEESCVFGASEIPVGALFGVSPVDEWGHEGREILSRPFG